ncbi:serine proteinase [Fomes fomentarius]|nr:serine proteinase [Fomes fomentarius]
MTQETNTLEVVRAQGNKKEGSYIVHLKAGVHKDTHLQWLRQRLSGNSEIKDNYSFLNAFSGTFNEDTLAVLRASSDVDRIEEDAAISLFNTVVHQRPCLDNQDPFAETFQYTYNDDACNPVDLYIMDTGILLERIDFAGRAIWGYTSPGLPDKDDNGHATQVASVAGGTHFGVFKNAKLIAVKIANAAGLAGMDWIIQNVQAFERPSVVNMSWGLCEPTPNLVSLDLAIAVMTGQYGIHVCAAAGNDNVDASTVSPARATSANTVGASNIADRRWASSNFGAVLDIFAPGENINMATIGDKNATTWSRTSFACPHVSGLIAYLISLQGDKTPYNMSQYSARSSGTPNLLANNGI